MICDKTMSRIADNIVITAQNEEKDVEEKMAKIAKMRDAFQELNKGLLDSLKELDEKKKAIEKKLKSNFKEWEQASDFSALRSQLLSQSQEMAKAGKSISAVIEGVKLEQKKSQKPSYATGFSVALTLLNEVTQNKYANLPDLCKKDIAALKTGIDVLDEDLSDFSAEIKEIADKRGLKISSKTFKADVIDFIKEIGTKIKNWFSKSVTAFKNLFKSSKQTTDKLEEFNRILSKA